MFDDAAVLAALGFPHAPLLGSGGEACVYSLGSTHVLRLTRPGASFSDAQARARLLNAIMSNARHLDFLTPEVLAIHKIGERIAVIERTLSGVPLSKLLEIVSGLERVRLIQNYLDAAASTSSIILPATSFGPIMGDGALRRDFWRDYAKARILSSARHCPEDLRAAVLAQADRPMDEPSAPALVHLDYFPANVLAEGERITAVLDFGASSVIGDARFELWSAVAYLDAEISPAATDADRQQAQSWLADAGLMMGSVQRNDGSLLTGLSPPTMPP
ncbi:aminoglycoside phosphotransferase family protein [Devosia sp. Leaf64]|uniref:phosphotransferase family protein n=1 Tax=Devosia sp. Leaf64 TaxID=1736229 RepID=UPI0007870C2D|nr:aminoglycoside phosphotransferase family protein [Devosia sp. Leaf64]